MKPTLLIAVGSSAGGVSALLEMVSSLPAELPVALCVVLHVGARPSILPQLLSRRGALAASHARDGEAILAGRIYVAPPDHHLLVAGESLRLSRGPRENHARPAIDPLFRTAALHWRERAVGVVLSGAMDDGTAGLAAIKAGAGIAVVQDPATAFDPSMPLSALSNVEVDHTVEPRQLGALLARLAQAAPQTPPAAATPRLKDVQREQAVSEGFGEMQEVVSEIMKSSSLTCPDCGGALWELDDHRPLRYRCHVGHAYSAQALKAAQEQGCEHSLQSGLRALEEREMLLRRLATVASAMGDADQASAGLQEARRIAKQAQVLRALLSEEDERNEENARLTP